MGYVRTPSIHPSSAMEVRTGIGNRNYLNSKCMRAYNYPVHYIIEWISNQRHRIQCDLTFLIAAFRYILGEPFEECLSTDIVCEFETSSGCKVYVAPNKYSCLGKGADAGVYLGFQLPQGTTNLATFFDNITLVAARRASFTVANEARVNVELQRVRHWQSISRQSMHLIPILESIKDDTDKKTYIVMPFATLGTVRDVMNALHGCRFRELIVAGIVEQCLLGLKCLHENDVAHRDIKPDNVVINFRAPPTSHNLLHRSGHGTLILQDVEVFLADPVTIRQEGLSDSRVGTNFYMPPESFAFPNQQKCYLNSGDLFSLARTIILMMCIEDCREIFGMWSNIQTYMYIPEIIERNYPLLGDLLKRMLQISAPDRISASDALDHPWFHPFRAQPAILEYFIREMNAYDPIFRRNL